MMKNCHPVSVLLPIEDAILPFRKRKEHRTMKGYTVESGYMGYMGGAYLLFADESDYREAYLESVEE